MLSIPLIASLLVSGSPFGEILPVAAPSLLQSARNAVADLSGSAPASDFGVAPLPAITLVLHRRAAAPVPRSAGVAQMPIAKPDPSVDYKLTVQAPKRGVDYKLTLVPPQ